MSDRLRRAEEARTGVAAPAVHERAQLPVLGSGPAAAPTGDGAGAAAPDGADRHDLPVVTGDGAMQDTFGRRIEYLRISVTDKCNLRCVYCMPMEGLPWLRREQILDYEEIAAITRVMAGMGLRRLRLTGGEPLVRKDLPVLVRLLAAIPGIEDIALSTNAVLLAPLAEELREAGISRVNISLDSLRPDRVDAISRRPGSHAGIMEGLRAAERVGFHPIKLNAVIMRGRNDDEVEDFARMTLERPWHVRFIEVMPVGDNLGISAEELVTADALLDRLSGLGALEPVQGPPGNGPATYFRYPGAPGTVGVITPMSHTYCHRCNRMRLTADGQLRPCLFGEIQTDLRGPLRRGEDLRPAIEHTLRVKPERHWLVQGSAEGSGGLRALSEVGG